MAVKKVKPIAPPAGSSRNWAANVRRVVEELESLFPVRCSTYQGHGRTGEALGIDVWVAPFRSRANTAQEQLGDRIQKHLERNWKRLGIDYLIWWNWMKDDENAAWFFYEPWAMGALRWPGGDPDPDTRRHLDHVHIQITAGATYRPLPTGPKEVVATVSDMEKARRIDAHLKEKNAYPWVEYMPLGEMVVDVCLNETGTNHLWISSGAAVCEKETGGKNIFGCDHGSKWTKVPPYCQIAVTEKRVNLLVKNIRDGGGSNGVGVTQITYPPYIYQAEEMGGAHIIRNQLVVGFNVLNDLLNRYDYLNALEAYNDGQPGWNNPQNGYEVEFARLHSAWKKRLG